MVVGHTKNHSLIQLTISIIMKCVNILFRMNSWGLFELYVSAILKQIAMQWEAYQ